MRRFHFFRKAVLFLLFPLPVFSQSITQRLTLAWQRLENDAQLTYSGISLTVIDTKTGEVLFSKNGDTGFAPASTLKTVTSATAFYLLGRDFTYATTVGYSGTIDSEGTLSGNLIIKGVGDPTLGSPRYPQTTEAGILKEWCDAIKAAGIRKITGSIIGDDRLFGTQTVPDGWIWEDIGNYYGAGAASLNWRENQFDLLFTPAVRPGEAVRAVKTDPDMPFLSLVNEVKTGNRGSGDGVVAYSAPYTRLVHLRGTYGIDLEKRIGASVPDPALDAAWRLKESLLKNGISSGAASTARAEGEAGHPAPESSTTIAVHSSPGLKQMVYWLNQKSINLYAEALIRTLAIKQGKEGTTAAGVAVVKQFWNDKLGIDKNALRMMDGSGLSPGTRVTTRVLARILSSVKKEDWYADYFESFPLINSMKMKSGSIENVQAYAGYSSPENGSSFAFSFIVNNYTGSQTDIKQKMFTVLDVLK